MRVLTYEETVRFHGHDGPFVTLGYRAGEYALGKLQPKKLMELECRVRTLDYKPYIAVMDGIQCSTPCTIGKGTLRYEKTAQAQIEIAFRNRKTDEGIVLILKADTMDRALKAEDLAKEAERVRSSPIDSLFEIESKENEITE